MNREGHENIDHAVTKYPFHTGFSIPVLSTRADTPLAITALLL